jgi:hypothetical protein
VDVLQPQRFGLAPLEPPLEAAVMLGHSATLLAAPLQLAAHGAEPGLLELQITTAQEQNRGLQR